MNEPVIVSTARTAIGTAFRGSLNDVDAMELGAHAVAEAVRRSGVDPADVDDVIMGESRYGGGDIARNAAIEAGLINAPGVAVNRHCASALAAIQSGASSISAGMDRVVVAGGSHSPSTAPRSTKRILGTDEWEDWAPPSHRGTPDAPNEDMSISVGWNAAVKAGVSREEMDAWAAGNSSGVNDAAAAVVIASRAFCEDYGLSSLAVIRGWASAGVEPRDTGLAPTVVIPKVLERCGLRIGDVSLWEINEAFAAMCVATTRILCIDDDIVNVLGSGCSLGHPTGSTGARMVVTLIHELRRRGGGVGVASMCAGGGMASAMVLEVPPPFAV